MLDKYLTRNALVLAAVTLGGYFGERLWLLDLLSHFRPHYAVIATVFLVAAFLTLSRNRILYLILICILVANGVQIFPYYEDTELPPQADKTFQAISLNLNRINTNEEQLAKYINRVEPNFLFFFELTPDLVGKISALKTRYPYSQVIARDDNFGIGIFSQHPLQTVRTFENEDGIPAIIANVYIDSRTLTVVGAHPFPPIHSEGKLSRDTYLERLATNIQNSENPVLLCGDLNVTAWSPVFSNFLILSGLVAPKGHGIVSTWPAKLGRFGIQIDHCLASENILISRYQAGPNVGSDHLPLEVEFSW